MIKKILAVVIFVSLTFAGFTWDIFTAEAAAGTELYYTSLISDSNLVAYYRMSGNSNDYKGSYNGTDTNISYSNSYGYFGQGAKFNGTTSKIVLGSSAIVGSGNYIWFHAWIDYTSYNGSGADNFILCSTGWNGNGQMFGYVYTNGTSTANLGFDIYGDSGNTQSSTNLSLNTWYMVDFVANISTQTKKIYINGTLDTTTTSAGLPANINTNEALGVFNNGTRNIPTDWFPGDMDDVAFFNRIPTQTDLNTLYASPPATNKSQLLIFN